MSKDLWRNIERFGSLEQSQFLLCRNTLLECMDLRTLAQSVLVNFILIIACIVSWQLVLGLMTKMSTIPPKMRMGMCCGVTWPSLSSLIGTLLRFQKYRGRHFPCITFIPVSIQAANGGRPTATIKSPQLTLRRPLPILIQFCWKESNSDIVLTNGNALWQKQ